MGARFYTILLANLCPRGKGTSPLDATPAEMQKAVRTQLAALKAEISRLQDELAQLRVQHGEDLREAAKVHKNEVTGAKTEGHAPAITKSGEPWVLAAASVTVGAVLSAMRESNGSNHL